jgi:hypothetical protein
VPALPPREIKVPDIETLRDLRIRCNECESLIVAVQKPLQAQLDVMERIRTDLGATAGVIVRELNTFAGRGGAAPTRVSVPNRNDTGQAARGSGNSQPIARDARPQTASAGNLSRAERLILTCLAQFGACAKNKVAAVTGYAVNGGGFNNALSSLRSKGFITPIEPMAIGNAGEAALGSFEPLPTGEALIAHWERQLSKAEAAIFRHVCSEHPNACTKEAIAAATGYEANGGGFNNALSRLRTLELINGRGEIRASDNLFS